ncbi:hypothetical protein JW979_11170 [bacterium]|nr:hypothetical protein [candidate division CSSED10-310 bacterium]
MNHPYEPHLWNTLHTLSNDWDESLPGNLADRKNSTSPMMETRPGLLMRVARKVRTVAFIAPTEQNPYTATRQCAAC